MSAVSELRLLQGASRDLDWLSQNFTSLVARYEGQFVAVKNREVVAASGSLDDLLSRLKDKGVNPRTTLVQRLTSAAVIL